MKVEIVVTVEANRADQMRKSISEEETFRRAVEAIGEALKSASGTIFLHHSDEDIVSVKVVDIEGRKK